MSSLTSLPLFAEYPIANDYLSGGNARAWFDYAPDEKGLAQRIAAIRDLAFDRKAVAAGLLEQNAAMGAPEDTLANIRRIAKEGALVVTTGHQPVLLGGPLFVAYKILTAVAQAKWITDNLKIPAVPLFWIGNDDDDLAEVLSATSPFGEGCKVHPGKYHGVTGRMPNPCLKNPTLPKIQAADWGEYHTRLIHQIFGKYGVIVMDPLHPATASLRAPFFTAFKGLGGSMFQTVSEMTSRIVEAGCKPQVNLREGDRFLFSLEGNARSRLMEGGEEPKGKLLTTSLSRLLSMEQVLPVVADIAGPSEIAYHAQTRGMYGLMKRTMPVILPRFSMTMARPSDLDTLKSFGLSVSELIEDRSMAEERAAEHSLPGGVRSALTELSEGVQNLYARFNTEISEIYPDLTGASQASQRKAMSIEAYLKKKILAAAKRRCLREDRALASAFDFIFPGQLQERAYNFIYFIEKDPAWTDLVLGSIHPGAFSHQIAEFEA